MNARTGILVAVAAGSLLSGCAAAQRAMPSTMSNENVMAVFNTIDRSEIEAAQLAKQKASSPAVRDFAGRMIDEHSTMLDRRRELASRLTIHPQTPQLAAAMKETHQETMEELRKKSGRDFDRAYMEYQVTMHDQAARLAEETGEAAENSRIKQHLMEAKSNIQSHLAQAKTVQRQAVAQQQQQ
jgi:putative membrane protein